MGEYRNFAQHSFPGVTTKINNYLTALYRLPAYAADPYIYVFFLQATWKLFPYLKRRGPDPSAQVLRESVPVNIIPRTRATDRNSNRTQERSRSNS